MFNGYILLAFLFMGLLFVRHILIYRQENKINYAPLVISIGLISSMIHFITYPENKDLILLIRESFFPLIVSLFLYIVMNILYQTQRVERSIIQLESTQDLINQISELKTFTTELEKEMLSKQEDELLAQKEIRDKFNEDIKSLEMIQQNQIKFLEKFDAMGVWHKDITNKFNDFIEIQLPALDGIVHKYIELLRIEEQDHFNKVKITLEKALENKCNIEENVLEVKDKLEEVKNMSSSISKSIRESTLSQLSSITNAFESQILSLKVHTDGVSTSLQESEHSLEDIKVKSKIIVEQMSMSSKKMEAIEAHSEKLYDGYVLIKDLINSVELIREDYKLAQRELMIISQDLRVSSDQDILKMKEQIDSIGDKLNERIDESLEKLYEHYHMTTNEMTKSVQILSQKNKLKGYGELNE